MEHVKTIFYYTLIAVFLLAAMSGIRITFSTEEDASFYTFLADMWSNKGIWQAASLGALALAIANSTKENTLMAHIVLFVPAIFMLARSMTFS